MRAGDLDRRIALQRKTSPASYSSSGEPVETWSTIAERWSAQRPVLGTELNAAMQWVAREQVEFRIRWSDDIQNLSPVDRIVYPSSDASVSPERVRSVYDIISVHEVGRHEELRILAARRVG